MPEGLPATPDYARRHLRFGWWSLLAFATLGLVLETLHGFKVRAYLDVANDTRRLMWTLAHAHGTLLALVHIVFGLCMAAVPDIAGRHARLMSTSLVAASILLPGGFFLGGVAGARGVQQLRQVAIDVHHGPARLRLETASSMITICDMLLS